jgi:hypothetical protein
LKFAPRTVADALYVPVWATPVWRVSVPPFVDQPAVVPYSTSPLPARLSVAVATHAAALQKPALQFASAVHVVRQAVAAASHWYAPHDVVVPATHVPVPLQVDAVFTTAPLHPAARQTVPTACLRQAPAPSQEPSLPQVVAALASHSIRGSVPGSAAMHVPTLPDCAHVWQVPPQALLQQTPSTQKPLPHSAVVTQAVPLPSCGTHAPARQ